MSDIIRLLPDSVANQIAAGEVIQRPASVVKELIENAIDANADDITVHIKDAGRTLIQLIDNGKGMSATDARMAFERHATSKIQHAEDLFSIKSMGFRGEALASIAAVADVELKTATVEDELGTYIHIKGSEIIKQEIIQYSMGSNFSIRNLFYNIPARRKFLKKDSTEFSHIVHEFKKTALAFPHIDIQLIHNEHTVYSLKKASLVQRISDIFGKTIVKQLVPVESHTEILTISGFVGKPDTAKKRNTEQFFFVNGRYMKHPYFYKSILNAYEQIIKADLHPTYFLFFDIAPERIDINIHPAKIQINFDDSQGIYQLLRASVKQALGKYNVVPSIDFDRDGYIEMPYSKENNSNFTEPSINSKQDYNPFEDEDTDTNSFNNNFNIKQKTVPANWDDLYSGFENKNEPDLTQTPDQLINNNTHSEKLFQFKNKYIITPVKSGLMIIHSSRAHERVLYESLLSSLESDSILSQKIVFPIEIQASSEDVNYLRNTESALNKLGFDIEFKAEKLFVKGLPAALSDADPKQLIEAVLVQIKDDDSILSEHMNEHLAEILARKASLNYNKPLAYEEMHYLMNQLFACRMPNFTKNGRKIIEIIKTDDIGKLFS